MTPEPFDSRAKAPQANRCEKGYGDENVVAYLIIYRLVPSLSRFKNAILMSSSRLVTRLAVFLFCNHHQSKANTTLMLTQPFAFPPLVLGLQ